MNSETRRMISAMLAAMAVFFFSQYIYYSYFAPPQPKTTTPVAANDANAPLVRDANAPVVRDTNAPSGTDATAAAPPVATNEPNQPVDANANKSANAMQPAPIKPGTMTWSSGESVDPITLGSRTINKLELELSPIGASVQRLYLTERDSHDQFAYAANTEETEPYCLLKPVTTTDGEIVSYSTHRLILHRDESRSYRLDHLVWNASDIVTSNDALTITFWTDLSPAGENTAPVLRLTKTYQLKADKPLFDITYDVENLTDDEFSVTIEQDGPVGIDREQAQYDMRTLVGAYWDGTRIQLESKLKRMALRKQTIAAEEDNDPKTIGPRLTSKGAFVWTATTNRFFGAFTRVVSDEGWHPDAIQSARGFVLLPNVTNGEVPGDMQVRLATKPIEVAAKNNSKRTFEVLAGPKDTARLEDLSEAYVDRTMLAYSLAEYADRYCMCTFQGLPWVMRKILHGLQAVVINYGIAIIILVVLIRSLLHRLTVFQQRSMFKTQEGMARLQPKMAEIKKKYADDQNKQNQETMRLFSEEGVNPAASLIGMIPMFIQMPILVAMWMSINSDVDLRHKGFFLWIDNLAQPDQFIVFSNWGMPDGLTIPLLGQLLPGMFAHIPALNLLPIIMGVGMYLQQKYMPKPGQKERTDARRKAAESSGDMSQFEQQMKQQETMAIMMSFMFPLMFYYMPSALNLYWLSTTVFGIGETLLIRRQLDREKAEGKFEQKKKSKGPGIISRFFAHIAEQAEEFQKQADDMSGKSNKGVRNPEKSEKNNKPEKNGKGKKGRK